MRRIVKQTLSLEDRLTRQVEKLRQDAEAAASPRERERLIRKARQLEVTARMSDWLRSPGLQPPD
jgi:hypothetical protein